MTATFIQLPKAQKEVIKAWEWYEEQQEGLGDRFLQHLREKINAIAANPLHYPVRGKYHEALTDVFPFLIVYKYRKNDNSVIIISVFHTSRNPRKKYKS